MLMQSRKWGFGGGAWPGRVWEPPWIRSEQMKTFLLREEKRHVMKTEGDEGRDARPHKRRHTCRSAGRPHSPFSQNVFYGGGGGG